MNKLIEDAQSPEAETLRRRKLITDNLNLINYILKTALLIFLLHSCMSNKTVSYLERCNQKLESDGYCLTKVEEMKRDLPDGRPLFYLGSDSIFHYFIYAYDKTAKISARMKILKEEFTPKYELFNKDEKKIIYDFPVYITEF